MLLTGAPISLVRRCMMQNPSLDQRCRPRNWRFATHSIMLPVLVEEDVKFYLESVRDSGWSNDDGVTDRHKGRGHLGSVDGHVELYTFRHGGPPPPNFDRFTAWHMWVDIGNKHVSVGRYFDPTDGSGIVWGFLQKKYATPGVFDP